MIEALQIILNLRDEAQQAALILLLAAALRWGAGPERLVAATICSITLADKAYHLIFGSGVELGSINVGHFVIDAAACCSLIFIALAANRMYTLWIGAFQILALLSHPVRLVAQQVSPIAYAIMQIAPSYFQIGLLAGGIWLHHRRSRANGTYRSWRHSSSHSSRNGHSTWLKGWWDRLVA